MRYAPHERLVRPARAQSAPWRLVVGAVVVFAVQIGLVYAAFGVVTMLRGPDLAASIFESIFVSTLTASGALWLLASFLFMIAGTLAATNLLHGRGLVSLTGPPTLAAAQFARVLWALTLLYAVVWALLPTGLELAPKLGLGRWFALLPLAVPAILIQCSAEELFFRGYLQQQLAARFRAPLVWIGLPAALFAWGHYTPDMTGQNASAVALWAGAFSVAAADLTARSGTLGPAIALHFATNASAILFVALPGPVSGLALYTHPMAADDPALMPLLLVDLGVLFVSWLAARVALRV
ncbi:hypothetical protein SAMN05444722_2979 [Rhodovulum sp. ES.010]|uniref:CPBP family intramembrane glutamic endopeptidase n=1 Tax=Rhodovulum sp. ES.010 TaxID=1882821 RepID=UPI00092AC721|nr:CPBP family intramembrane glutamic endopeptidase [Rhodovulum sp. ES.010]SIO51778.1 hypothetical protein SAMN05444722_2979 [Rhodovulum sp. ES.010]